MDTNVHEWVEPRMDTNGLNHETHEIHEREIQNHECTRMDTNGVNHETHEIHERDLEPRMDTNGHEYHLFIIRIHWLLEG